MNKLYEDKKQVPDSVKKKAKELSSKQESEERASKAKEEIDKKRNAQKLKGDDRLPTDPIDDPAGPIDGPSSSDDDIIIVGLAVPGCMDPAANNYDPSVGSGCDDGSCTYTVDCAGVINGTAVLDRCGVCDGDGTSCQGCLDPAAVGGYDASYIAFSIRLPTLPSPIYDPLHTSDPRFGADY